MAINIAINGFGRIGRLTLRALIDNKNFNVVAINDIVDPEYLAYLLRYDSTHGQLTQTINHEPGFIRIGAHRIHVAKCASPSQCPWQEYKVDLVFECTGLFLTTELANGHLEAGAKNVIISAPSVDAPMYVMGVNEHEYESHERIISNASCTTNCLAPLAKVIHDKWGIAEGLMTTVHAATASQRTVDGVIESDWRGARSMNNIIPSSTGAAKAVGKIIPQLQGKLTGMAFRVPTTDVSVVDLTVRLTKPATYEEIKHEIRHACAHDMKGIMEYSEEALVSSDSLHNPHSCIFDATAGIALNDQFVKLIAWYDNEWGYVNRLIDLAEHMLKCQKFQVQL